MKPLPPRRWHRWFYFEYWPVWLFYLPALPYWVILAIRSKSILYFTAANPGIEHGGFFGESKAAILDKIPADFKAKTFHFKQGTAAIDLFTELTRADLNWPLVCKPDSGERGYLVAVIHRPTDLLQHIEKIAGDFIVQEYVSFPLEFGIFYYRFPDGKSGISSIVQKEFLSVTGDGHKNVRMLMGEQLRSLLQIDRFEREKPDLLLQIPEKGEKIILEHIGNHCKGTKFLDASALITPALVALFDLIADEMKGIYYGRFDLKVSSLEDLYAGKNIRILEFNGATSEVAHIYHPGFPILKAYRAVFYHIGLLQKISLLLHKKNIPFSPLLPFLRQMNTYFRSKKNKETEKQLLKKTTQTISA